MPTSLFSYSGDADSNHNRHYLKAGIASGFFPSVNLGKVFD